MFSSTSYLIAWVVYLLGSVGLMVVVWRLTQGVRLNPLKFFLRLSTAIVLLFPYVSDPTQDYLAPGVIIILLEGVFEGLEAMGRAGEPLLFTWLLVLVLAAAAQLSWRWFRRRREVQRCEQQQLDGERQALPEASQALTSAGRGPSMPETGEMSAGAVS